MVAGLKIKDAQTLDEQQAVRDLLCQTFEVRPGVGKAFAKLYDQVLETPARSRVALLDGHVVGHALLASRTFDLAGVVFQGGIVAMVTVDDDVRGQGIGRALIQDMDGLARAQEMAVLQVAGDPRLYTQFGFIPSYEEAIAHLDISALGDGHDALRVATETDVTTLAKISLAEQAMGAVVADETRWEWILKSEHPKGLLACNDRLVGLCAEFDVCLLWHDVGYVRVCGAKDRLVIYEMGCFTQDVERLLKAFLAWGYNKGGRVLQAYLPSNSRFLDALVEMGASKEVHEDHELNAKILNVPYVLTQMTDVFSKRVGVLAEPKRLGLSIGNVQIEMFCGDGVAVQEVDVVGNVDWHLAVSEAALIRALWGVSLLYDPEGDPVLDGLLTCLFPKLSPFFALADSL